MDCIFCKIARKDIPAELLFENENIMAFRDINPLAPVHILISPKKHIPGIAAVETYDLSLLAEILTVAQKLARQNHVHETGYRIFINSGPDAGQEVSHLHVRLVGGAKLSAPC